MGINPEQSEPIQAQWYNVGEEFKPHTDYFEPDSSDYEKHTEVLGQRSWTFMVYLNTTNKGGATEFPDVGVAFEPKAGTAVIWNNLSDDGSLNHLTMHHGTPVEQGFKVIITKWFRSQSATVEYQKESNEYLKPLTRVGFLKSRMPSDLFSQIENFYKINVHSRTEEVIPDFISSEKSQIAGAPSELVELTPQLRQHIHRVLQPIVEAWIGDYLEPTFVYGIRNYKRGSVLKVHRDRLETHIASAILNIRQKVDKDWVLFIEDHHYKQHEISLEPGDMLLYEGARLSHGRPSALDGDEYANVFVHYKCRD